MSMTPNLFVYGSLLRGFGHPMHEVLQRYAVYQGPGYINGKLFDIGDYPGLILSNNVRKVVEGEIYTIRDEDNLFLLLDRYEGCDKHAEQPCEYQRDVVTINNDEDITMLAWSYLYKHPVENNRLIPDGNYLTYRNKGYRRLSLVK